MEDEKVMELVSLHIPTRVVFGENTIDGLGDLVREIGAQHALIVTDAGVAAVGHVDRAARSLARAGIHVEVFDAVQPNPTTSVVDACVEVARGFGIDLLIGLGGGSSIDTARACNFLLTNGGRMQAYHGIGKATKPMLPFVAIPTTTGTGSEMQSFASIADGQTRQKMACGDKKAASTIALLDPTLSMTQPRHVIACSGLDCMAHAIESAVTRSRTPFSSHYSREAWRLASDHLVRVLDDPSDLEAQGQMLLASAFAGIAIEHSMLGAAHAAANPLTAQLDVVHGIAVGIMLPHIIRFNSFDDSARSEYAILARLADPQHIAVPDNTAAEALVAMIESALRYADLPSSLIACGVKSEAINTLAEHAANQWTSRFNPRPVQAGDFRDLYRAAL